jgi:hypothetical protein
VLDAADVIRSRKVSDDVTLRCQHILQECPHINTADGLMFIHSLYYFSHPQDILNALRRTRRGIAVSVHHVFHRPRGDFCLRECSYQTKNDRVVMTVHGETPSYSHGSLRWVHQSNYYADERGSLIWKPFSHTPDAELVESHLGPVMPGATLPRPVGLRAVVRDDEFIGEVDLRSPLNESPTMLYTTEEIALSLQLTNAYSWREGLVLGVAEQPVDIFVPKSFIFDIATQVMGMERSATTHRTLMGWAKRRIDRFNIPHDERPLVLNVAVTLGFMLYAEQETRVLTTYIAPQVDMLADHSRALAFDFPWRPKPWLVAAAAAVGIGLSFYEPKDPTPACFTLGPQRWTGDLILRARATLAWFRQFDAGNLRDWWRGRPASTTAGSFGVAIARALGGSRLRTVLRWAFRAACLAALWWALRRRPPRRYDPAALLEHGMAASVPDGLYPPIPPIPARNYAEVKLDAIDESATIRAGGLQPSGRAQTSFTQHLGIAVAGAFPTVVASDADNELVSVNNRACASQAWDDAYCSAFRTWVGENFDNLFPGWRERLVDGRIEPVPYADWNERFPRTTRLNHDRALDELKHYPVADDLTRLFRHKTFVKREKHVTFTDSAEKMLSPRTIQGCSDGFNVCTGPWVRAVASATRAMWNASHVIYWASGSSAEQVGAWYDGACHGIGHFCAVENDCSRFDATLHVDLWAVILDICMAFGANRVPTPSGHTVYGVLKAACLVFGKTPHGVRYRVEGTMASGHPGTAVFDTWINGLGNLFVFCRTHNARVSDILRRLNEGPRVELSYESKDNAAATAAYNAEVKQAYVDSAFDVGIVDLDNWRALSREDARRYALEVSAATRRGDQAGVTIHRELVPFFKCVVQGDDFLALLELLTALRTPFPDGLKRLGLRPKTAIRTERSRVTFCSGLFWPTMDGSVLGPMPGKLVSKLGWTITSPTDGRVFMRGVCLGLRDSVWHVPVAAHFVERTLELTEDVKAEPIAEAHKLLASRRHLINDDTLVFLFERYGWTTTDIMELSQLLQSVKRLPTTLAFGPLRQMLEIDGIVEGPPSEADDAKMLQPREKVERPPPHKRGQGLVVASVAAQTDEELQRRIAQLTLVFKSLNVGAGISMNPLRGGWWAQAKQYVLAAVGLATYSIAQIAVASRLPRQRQFPFVVLSAAVAEEILRRVCPAATQVIIAVETYNAPTGSPLPLLLHTVFARLPFAAAVLLHLGWNALALSRMSAPTGWHEAVAKAKG